MECNHGYMTVRYIKNETKINQRETKDGAIAYAAGD